MKATFLVSLLLSLIAHINHPVINRDGIFYVETARIFLEEGFLAAFKFFNWPFMPMLMGLVAKLTGIDIEPVGNVLNALFMAGACALVVACAERCTPEAAWQTCLVVLALPGLNDYRNELIREYGCWFFMMLAFWLALKWDDSPRWAGILLAQASLAVAALFRPEAVVFFAALVLWQLFKAQKHERWKRLAMVSLMPAAGTAAVSLLVISAHFSASRISGDLARISIARFDAKAQALAEALIPYARDQARTILFFGSLAIIPLKFVKQLGAFIVPLFFLVKNRSVLSAVSRAPLLIWALLMHVLVLSVFVVDMQFLAGRYVATLSLLVSPVIGYGLYRLMHQYPRWRNAIIVCSVLLMASNVISISPRQTHFRQAASWLNEHTVATERARVFMHSSRTAYYAGMKNTQAIAPGEDRERIQAAIRSGKFNLFVFEASRREADIEDWLKANKLTVVQRFLNGRSDSVIIASYVP